MGRLLFDGSLEMAISPLRGDQMSSQRLGSEESGMKI